MGTGHCVHRPAARSEAKAAALNELINGKAEHAWDYALGIMEITGIDPPAYPSPAPTEPEEVDQCFERR